MEVDVPVRRGSFISRLGQRAANGGMVHRGAGQTIPLRAVGSGRGDPPCSRISRRRCHFFLELPHVLQLQLTKCWCKRAGGEADSALRGRGRIRIQD